VSEVDSVKQHAQLYCIDLDLGRSAVDLRNLESTPLKPFVDQYKAAARPEKALYPVSEWCDIVHSFVQSNCERRQSIE